MWRGLPFQYRVALYTFLAGALMVLLVAQQSLRSTQRQLEDLAADSRLHTLQIVALRSESALLTSEYSELGAQLERLALDPELRHVDVLDLDGVVVSSSDRSHIGQREERRLIDDDATVVESLDVRVASGLLGTVRIDFDRQPTLQALADGQRDGLLVGVLGVGFSAMIALFAGATFAIRLRRLTEQLARVDPDGVPLPVDAGGTDSLGIVSRALNNRTDRIRAQIRSDAEVRDALRLSEARLQLALSAAADAVIESNMVDGSFEAVGAGLGVLPDGRLRTGANTTLWDAVHPDDVQPLRDVIDAHVRDPSVAFEHEARVLSLAGQWLTLRLRGQAVGAGKDRPDRLMIAALDITEHRELERQLRHAEKMRSIGELTSGIAHDFNNMLAVSTLVVSMLQDPDRDRSLDDERFAQLQRSNDTAAALIARLLMGASGTRVSDDVVDVNRLIRDVVSSFAGTLGPEIGTELTLDARMAAVRIDEARAQQLVINLMQNAADAMDGSGVIRISTQNSHVLLHETGVGQPHLRLIVSDAGTGIDPSVMTTLFEPFITTKPVGTGTGLGLATSYETVTQAGGHIEAANDEELGGASFVVLLPCDPGGSWARPATETPSSEAWTQAQILLVEDNEGVLASVSASLTRNGHQVTEAIHPDEALAHAAQMERIDLLLTDVQLPAMNGVELAARIGGMHADVRVLFMSGYVPESVAADGLSSENTLMKPFNSADLLARVSQALCANGDDTNRSGAKEN